MRIRDVGIPKLMYLRDTVTATRLVNVRLPH